VKLQDISNQGLLQETFAVLAQMAIVLECYALLE